MAKNVNHISHVSSNVVENGKPKLPLANALVEGEIAVNYAEGFEVLSIKNESGDVVTFSSDNYYTSRKLGSGFTGENSANTVTSVIEENEIITSAALNDLNTKKLDVTAYTPTDLSNYYTKSQTSGATEISSALDNKQDSSGMTAYTTTSAFDAHSGDTNLHLSTTEKENIDALETNISAISGISQSNINSWTNKANANHQHPSSSVTAMTDYSIAASSGAIATTDTLNEAIGKLEKTDGDIISVLGNKQDLSEMSAYTTNAHFDEKLGSAFTGAYSSVTVTEVLENVEIDVDQVIDSGTSASTNAVATHAVYDTIADNELVWTNAYVVISGAIRTHTANTEIHRVNKVSKTQISSNTTVSCPGDITGATNDGAQATVIYENTSTTTDYSVTVASGYKTPNGGSIILTCPANGFCKVTYINIEGTIYASGN